MVRAAAMLVAATVLLAGCTGGGGGAEPASGSAPAASSSPAESAGAAAPESPSAAPSVQAGPLSYEDILVDGTYTTEAICTEYRTKIAKYAKAAKGRVSSGSGSAQGPYEAASYRRTHAWVKDELAARFDESLDVSARKALNAVSGNRAGELDSVDAYFRDSIDSCGLSKALQSARALTRKSDALGERIIRQARLKPWYPKGYFEMDEGLAGRWISGASDPCGYGPRCWYWTLDVTSKDGCPDGVYVAINMTNGGSVIDWSNDSLPSLRARQTGRLQFYTYDLAADTAEISDVSCY